MLRLEAAVVVCPAAWCGAWHQAVEVLVEEVAARTGVCWRVERRPPETGVPAVVLSAGVPLAHAGRPLGPEAWQGSDPEGYRLRAWRDERGVPHVGLAALTPRGLLFAAGRLLRELDMGPGRVALPAALDIASAPRYRVRGHQLGYRPKNNTYDAWSPERFERYTRDLALFGGNMIELLPPTTDDDESNPLMRLPKDEMLARVTAMLARYGLLAGLWYPMMAADYTDPGTVAAELAVADAVFARCARLDSVFVPGGDPGHTAPRPLCAFLERLAEVLRLRHPGAEVWLSGQGFAPPVLHELFALLRRDSPTWLTGVVYAPWTACTLSEMRAALGERYALRLYPDIAHTMHCQFPVPTWDFAFIQTLGREPINPLPEMQNRLFHGLAPGTVGFVTYSEGVNDDCNKFIWTALGWDPDADVGAVLRQYARLLVAPRHADAVAQALFALERNWEGPLRTSAQVPITLDQTQAIERSASREELGNWRLLSVLYRAYYDAYVQRRLVATAAREEAARDWLGRAPTRGALAALHSARRALAPSGFPEGASDRGPGSEDAGTLEEVSPEVVAPEWRRRIEELAGELFAGIGLQLSVLRYGASGLERGANLDALDAPLGDGPWLAAEIDAILALPTEGERLQALAALQLSHSPGPGGFLDDLGTHGAQPHLVGGPLGSGDPSFLDSVRMVSTPPAQPGAPALPRLWRTAAETLYGVPLVLRYAHLDPSARYRVRVLYHGRYRAAVSLYAGGQMVHGPLRPSDPPAPVTFPLPAAATGEGVLTLTWRLEDGRGIQVAAVWLMRDDAQGTPGPEGGA